MKETFQVYRHFDSKEVLLYVGKSSNTVRRTSEHRKNSHWFGKVSRIDVEHFDNEIVMLNAESEAIRLESPLYNKIQPKKIVNDAKKAARAIEFMRKDEYFKQYVEDVYSSRLGLPSDISYKQLKEDFGGSKYHIDLKCIWWSILREAEVLYEEAKENAKEDAEIA